MRRKQILDRVSAFEARGDAAGILRSMGDADKAWMPDLWLIVQERASRISARARV